ncbi:bifunctional [glutamate--ammonia ligase]-adenylyl-L-tyrosine phosphorylase/[glutamate--ammonia-ligase] adenylyltransferase [Desulfococcaceae bacterium HSG9]|nr:bifunctional [glutamate--ammonia ligase]-adenylyl-L-tyrosine phosphorylase/[glutamate--ammonia-ligase] adenylyltransferase [Desulfococcaceae bacterium HSG9]
MIKLPSNLKETALNRTDAFFKAAGDANLSLPDTSEFNDALERVFAFSEFVAQNCIRNPALLTNQIANGALKQKKRFNEYGDTLDRQLDQIKDSAMLSELLRRFRLREMVRIAWRDLAGWAGLSETMEDLSALADACIGHARDYLHHNLGKIYGIPVNSNGQEQSLVVLGMGKLGACELNFSSDVDLIFAYPSAGSTQGTKKTITNEEFFLRLARQLIKTIGANTADGIVFRVDMDLRPYGASGPVVLSFDAMVDYYERQGREWERYAWIKARAVADKNSTGKSLLEALRPFVFRRYLDFGVFESLRKMKSKIAHEVARRAMADHIKLGPGGIREIEFFAQVFQLLRGGVTPVLQQRRIQKIIPLLADEGFITKPTCNAMLEAYEFLRMVENRLQAYKDQQCHDLPNDSQGLARLAASMGFDDADAFNRQLQVHRENVERQFQLLLEFDDSHASESDTARNDTQMELVWNHLNNADQFENILSAAGFEEPVSVIKRLDDLQNSRTIHSLSAKGRDWIDKLIPQVLRLTGQSEQPAQTLNRIIDLIKAIAQRINYLALLLENPTVLTHLIKLADASPWIITFLSHHPVLLDELLDPRTLYAPPEKEELGQELKKKSDVVFDDDLEHQIETLCIFKQIQVLRVAAADVTGALKLMRTSDYLTGIAETVLQAVLDIAWRHLVSKHGKPHCIWNGKSCEPGFAVIAYGKLGGIELGYNSDLDLVFLHAGTSEKTKGGAKPIDNAQFFARLGQRVLHILTAHTRAGRLYETDMRLRPSGSSGLLVCHIDVFQEYQMNQARTWEHQALIRARPVCGDRRMALGFEQIRNAVLAQPRDAAQLQKDVADMRRQLRQSQLNQPSGKFDLKQGIGGIVDIEFLVQYLVLANAHRYPDLAEWTDNVRLLETLTDTEILDTGRARLLKKAYLTWRKTVHRLNLQEKTAKIPDDNRAALRQEVKNIWMSYFD